MPAGRQGLTFPAWIRIFLDPGHHWRRLPGSPCLLGSWVLVQAGVPEGKDTLSEHQLASPSASRHRIAPCRSPLTRDHSKHVPLSLAASATGCASCLRLPATMQRKV